MSLGERETTTETEENESTHKDVIYTGIFKRIKIETNGMFRIIFKDNFLIFVNNAYYFGWKEGIVYEIRVRVHYQRGTSTISSVKIIEN